ncbi:hypothetical protein OGH69_10365 [Flavobacterium sp. MFBS3-15]|uniref:DUF6702 family protein n=1 Tax=Flavobacterium sp. MFBS3-15 TaxID=2989816 RepID=UPI00223595B8|nr:DUF6702 family protein [Flavobacterium sp. MFBS3-15]MCW4469369.1 hypothetical protein [Flavobacterium sp. MFBS3-15]
MKHFRRYLFLIILAFALASAGIHKYYVSVFQIEHVQKKKVLQMTARIFIDDMELGLQKKYGKKFYLTEERELPDTEEHLSKYFSEKVTIKVNGKLKPVKYLAKEMENDVLVCYFTIEAGTKVNSVEMKNTTLLDVYPKQQNIINVKINSNKKSLLLTNDEPEGLLEF